ncbi:hypothetical protein FKM82_021638 [Ascaphus truei]
MPHPRTRGWGARTGILQSARAPDPLSRPPVTLAPPPIGCKRFPLLTCLPLDSALDLTTLLSPAPRLTLLDIYLRTSGTPNATTAVPRNTNYVTVA